MSSYTCPLSSSLTQNGNGSCITKNRDNSTSSFEQKVKKLAEQSIENQFENKKGVLLGLTSVSLEEFNSKVEELVETVFFSVQEQCFDSQKKQILYKGLQESANAFIKNAERHPLSAKNEESLGLIAISLKIAAESILKEDYL